VPIDLPVVQSTKFDFVINLRTAWLIALQDGYFRVEHPDSLVTTQCASHTFVNIALPTIYNVRAYAEAGSLMSYGTSLTEAFRQMGVYTAWRIAKRGKLGPPVVEERVGADD
jgi:hypothetical protein